MYSVNIKKGLHHDGDGYSHVYAGYPQIDFHDTPEGAVKSIVSAKIDFLDFLILIIMWVLIFASTVIRLGHAPGILFLILNLVLVLRKPSNGFLVLLLIWFMPTGLLFIWRPFVVSAAIAMIGYVLHGTYFKYKAFFLNKMVWAVLAFVMFAGLSVVIAYGSETALHYYIEYVEGFIFVCMVFALINTKDDLGRALKWLVIVAGMSFFISLCHYYLGPGGLLYAITEDAQGIGFAVDKTTLDIGGLQIRRLMWPGNEPNYFGAQLIFPFAIGLGLYSASPKTRSKIFWIGFVALIGFAILGTYSRSSVIVGLIVLILFLIKRKLRALIPVFLVLVATYVIIMFIPGIWDRIMTILPSIAETGGSGRFELWRSAVMLWMSSPIFGHGMGEAQGHY